MDKLIERAKEEQAWGRPGVLYALLAMAKAHPSQVKALVGLLSKLPGAQLTAAIVPLVGAEPWGTDVFAAWKKTRDVGAPVLGAIKTVEEGK
jgi:xanthosine utilization system XapX-like protein